jgi:hypothetical protein
VEQKNRSKQQLNSDEELAREMNFNEIVRKRQAEEE